ncbi:SRPBCC family protein [Variovorax sp. J22R133]|uniref:SRPBCC family protein n=1 Tax=Variovorax brevis TaxID=3053503 RepID=UPI0025772AE2|nr:SRPBCC family protein [Variovorax sp. J22R133]MDM0112723.1 SRPBCC family protein [Variovorax sp. J22R133]
MTQLTGLLRCLRAAACSLALASLPWIAVGASAQQIQIETAGRGELITVTATADMAVELLTAWNAISDYDHLAEFIPDMSSSRVVQREGDKVLVDQAGQFSFLFFRQPVDVKMEVTETPPRRIVARAVGGNLKEFEGRYALEHVPGGGVRLTYSGRLVPDFPVPPVIGPIVVRNMLAKQFTALVTEIMRRDALAKGVDPVPARSPNP